MENDRSNDVSKRGISGIVAGVLGLVYSVGVLTIFILASVSVDESETELKKSWLRLTYLVFCMLFPFVIFVFFLFILWFFAQFHSLSLRWHYFMDFWNCKSKFDFCRLIEHCSNLQNFY